jgi:hypothetical protein
MKSFWRGIFILGECLALVRCCTRILHLSFDRLGWAVCVSVPGVPLIAAGVLARALQETHSLGGISAGRLTTDVTRSA